VVSNTSAVVENASFLFRSLYLPYTFALSDCLFVRHSWFVFFCFFFIYIVLLLPLTVVNKASCEVLHWLDIGPNRNLHVGFAWFLGDSTALVFHIYCVTTGRPISVLRCFGNDDCGCERSSVYSTEQLMYIQNLKSVVSDDCGTVQTDGHDY